jgi:hypothetical protein
VRRSSFCRVVRCSLQCADSGAAGLLPRELIVSRQPPLSPYYPPGCSRQDEDPGTGVYRKYSGEMRSTPVVLIAGGQRVLDGHQLHDSSTNEIHGNETSQDDDEPTEEAGHSRTNGTLLFDLGCLGRDRIPERFAACLMPPNRESVCNPRARPMCRSALLWRGQRSSFWRVALFPPRRRKTPTRCGRRIPDPEAPAGICRRTECRGGQRAAPAM